MSTKILALNKTQYCLADADRRQLLATVPAKINYPGGILPNFLVRQHVKNFPKFAGRTDLPLSEAESIMDEEIKRQYDVFAVKNGVIFD